MDHPETSQTKEDEVVTHLQKDDQNGYTSHSLIPQKKVVDKLVEKIKNKTVDIQTFQGFSRGRMDQVIQSLSPFKRKHHVFFGTTSRELSLPIELTNNQVEIQLILAEEVRRDLSKMKPEVANTMKWIHIGAIQLVVKSALYPGIDTPIDIAICNKRVTNARDSVLGAFSGNHYAKQIIAELYPHIAYNLQDAAYSRALTLYQDYKRNDLLTGGNMPYSITYQVSYALSNSHHTNLFLGKDFIEIPKICKEVAKAINPDQVEIPQIREIDIQIGDKQVLNYDQSLRLKAPRLSFQGERLTSRPLERSFSHSYERNNSGSINSRTWIVLVDTMTGTTTSFAEKAFEEKRQTLWHNKMARSKETCCKFSNMDHLGHWVDHLCAECPTQKEPEFGKGFLPKPNKKKFRSDEYEEHRTPRG
ncbi:uncharacterized protein LOC130993496 [Salvia miltiorrhiza]|uniref:uncharacterized protein LOC130993496 n=1 Tax=Salvia miltiorrhiza TaxID=226208 RepID=UPI0025AD99B9|nr:uncharacterized protein LOC130993496 [Salvia miltiorrhiza]